MGVLSSVPQKLWFMELWNAGTLWMECEPRVLLNVYCNVYTLLQSPSDHPITSQLGAFQMAFRPGYYVYLAEDALARIGLRSQIQPTLAAGQEGEVCQPDDLWYLAYPKKEFSTSISNFVELNSRMCHVILDMSNPNSKCVADMFRSTEVTMTSTFHLRRHGWTSPTSWSTPPPAWQNKPRPLHATWP